MKHQILRRSVASIGALALVLGVSACSKPKELVPPPAVDDITEEVATDAGTVDAGTSDSGSTKIDLPNTDLVNQVIQAEDKPLPTTFPFVADGGDTPQDLAFPPSPESFDALGAEWFTPSETDKADAKPAASFAEFTGTNGKDASAADLRFPKQPSAQAGYHQRISFEGDASNHSELLKRYRIDLLTDGLIGPNLDTDGAGVIKIIELFGRPDQLWLSEYEHPKTSPSEALNQHQDVRLVYEANGGYIVIDFEQAIIDGGSPDTYGPTDVTIISKGVAEMSDFSLAGDALIDFGDPSLSNYVQEELPKK